MSNKDEILDNLLSPAHWVRILFMLMFAVITWFTLVIMILVIVLQCLFNLITSKSNDNLQNAAKVISLYLYQIVSFLTYVSNNKPFPFSPMPSADNTLADVAAQQADAAAQQAENSQDPTVSTTSESTELNSDVDPVKSEGSEDGTAAQENAEASEDSSATPSASSELNDDVFADISFTEVDEASTSASESKADSEKSEKDDDKDKEKNV